MKFQFALLAGLLIAAPAVAQDRPVAARDRGGDNSSADTRRTGDVDENGERLICRTLSPSSTSRMAARRVCRTAPQWRSYESAE